MKKGFIRVILSVVLIFFFISSAQAQYFKFDTAQDDEEIREEVEAILQFFGALVGGGLYHTADLHNTGGLDVGLRGVVANVPDEFKDLPVFSEEDRLGLAFLHGSLGLPGNFELLGRFFYFPLGADQDINASPPRAADSRGGVTLIGGGLKYGLIQAPGVPKVLVMGTYHALFVPDEFDFGTVSTLSFNGVVSHSIPLLSVYAGAGVDITTLKLNDEFLGGDRFSETVPHATLGAKVSVFPFVHVNGSYNIGKFNSFDLGIGVSFR